MNSPSISINIFLFKINSFENGSAVNIGENFLADWNNSTKKTQGFGQNAGDDTFLLSRGVVDDRDGVDAPTFQNSNPSVNLSHNVEDD